MFSLIFSLVFLALLELIVFFPESYFWLAVLGVLALSSYVGNPQTRRAEQSRRTQWSNPRQGDEASDEASHDGWRATPAKKTAFLVLSVLLSLVAVLLLGVSRNIIFSQAVVLSASLIFYALASGYLARNISALSVVSFVELFAVVFLALIYQTASAASGWVTGPMVFIAASLLFFLSIYLTIDPRGPLMIRLLFFSFLAGLVTAEFYLALSHLPFNLPSIDFLVFIIYYGLWDISSRYFSRRLTKKALLFNILLIVSSYAAVFLSAKWFPEV